MTTSYTDFYYKLFNAKEDYLLTTTGLVQYEGSTVERNEDLTPCNQSDVVLNWIECIGGAPLVDHVFCVFSKDLATETLHDVKQKIIDNIETLVTEAEHTSKTHQIKVNRTDTISPCAFNDQVSIDRVNIGHCCYSNCQAAAPPPFSRQVDSQNQAPTRRPLPPGAPCKYCQALKLPQANSYDIDPCFKLKKVAANTTVVSNDTDPQEDQTSD